MGRGGGSGAFFLGVALFVVGVGATVFSYMRTAPGGTYIVFGGLILGGLIRMATALMGGMGAILFQSGRGRNRADAGKAAWYEDPNAQYVEKLADVPSGYCWQCGSKLRRGRALCMACGAAQTTAAPARSTTATPGGMTFGPPPKQARSGHPHDSGGEQDAVEEPDELDDSPPPRPRAFYPADPDGSYGWGPAYTRGDIHSERSTSGSLPGGRGRRADDERQPRPAPGRDVPRGARPASGELRQSGALPRDPGRRPPRQEEDAPPRRRAPRPEVDTGYRQPPPRRPRADDDGWGDDAENEDDSRDWRQSARRQAMRPRPRRPDVDDGDGWDDDDYNPPRSPRGR